MGCTENIIDCFHIRRARFQFQKPGFHNIQAFGTFFQKYLADFIHAFFVKHVSSLI
ncbi:hypothetical protein imdm_591 [gamma proteobacterium IMCC2047]|nr:hypothetical protein imdm_591 [gamma proteobacterium IMCC2047]